MTKTISQVFDEFLADQETRISHKTFLKYQSIISLYKSYLESYWPGHNGEYEKITKAGSTFCDTFGPEDATSGYSEFLGYFMPRKVMCGKETMQAAGPKPRKPLNCWKITSNGKARISTVRKSRIISGLSALNRANFG